LVRTNSLHKGDPPDTNQPGVWKAPKEFNVMAEAQRSVLLSRLHRLRRSLSNGESICIDFSETEKMFVDGTLLFLAELRRLIKHYKGQLSITCIPPKNEKVAQVLQQIGIFSLLGVPNEVVPKDDDVVNWRFAHGHKVEGERYEDVLAEYDGDITPELQEQITGIRSEVIPIDNIFNLEELTQKLSAALS